MFDPTDEIKAKIDIVDLVSQYVQLKKAGRNFKGLCPFHKEKTPSFIVSPDKQIAYCFGCHKGGDIFKFMMDLEHLEFPEALDILAKRAGVHLEKVEKQDKTLKQNILEMNRKAQEYFVANLKSKEGKKALEYLHKRGLQEKDMMTFGLGYALDSFDALYKYLLSEGYGKREILEAGLVTQKEFSADSLYDKFRHRIIFPIRNVDGDIVAFAGRVMDDALPKYLNSPETPVYHKSNVVYNLDLAKESIREKGYVLIVEGYMDAITAYMAGITNVIAVCGTALTDQQVKLLKRFSQTVYFCFDGDAAGMEAMKRNAPPVIKQQMMLKVIPLSAYKDPDEYIRKDASAFFTLLQTPHDFVPFVIEQSSSKYAIQTIEGRRQFISEVFPLIKMFPFEVEKDMYIKQVADLLDTTPANIVQDMNRLKELTLHTEPEEENMKKFDLSHYILGMLLLFPDLFPLLQDQIPEISWPTEFLKNIYNKLLDQYNDKSSVQGIEHVDLSAGAYRRSIRRKRAGRDTRRIYETRSAV
jgi:DNA primase